jgi:hypothetical protein
MGAIYELAIEMTSDGMIYIPSFFKIGTGVQAISGFCIRNLIGCNIGITDPDEFMNYAVQVDSYSSIDMPSFIKIGSAIQKILGEDTKQTHKAIS